MSSLTSKALCIVINFLVLWSICLSSSIVYFKNGPENLTRSTAQAFLPLMKFLLGFLKISRLSEAFFCYFPFHLGSCDGVCYQYSQVLVISLLFKGSKTFPYLLVLFFPQFSFLLFFEHGAFSMQNFILSSGCIFSGVSSWCNG